ncbi:MAG: AIR synthase [Firmicutes bacterium]|nr:AIR synthase [Bacillota bacterium]
MNIGKLPNDVLEKLVFDNIGNKREDVLLRAGVGEDCSVLDFGKYGCVISTDPITGASSNLGSLAIHISCNDVASNGAEPIGVTLTIMAPEDTKETEIEEIMKDASKASKELNVEIIGGHTEITNAVNKIVVSTTVIGKQLKEKILNIDDIKIGDKILMTKTAGLEGTAIIASDLKDKLENKLSKDILKEAKDMIKDISVVKEGIICGNIGVSYMHDVTEGGILGALWETAKAIKKGVRVYKKDIPIADSTKDICNILNIDPLKLISSGSMIIVANDENTLKIKSKLKENNIKVSVIGEITKEDILIEEDDEIKTIKSPESDELYKVI